MYLVYPHTSKKPHSHDLASFIGMVPILHLPHVHGTLTLHRNYLKSPMVKNC